MIDEMPATRKAFKFMSIFSDKWLEMMKQARLFKIDCVSDAPADLMGLDEEQYNAVYEKEVLAANEAGFSFVAMPFKSCIIEDLEGAVAVMDIDPEKKVSVAASFIAEGTDRFGRDNLGGYGDEVEVSIIGGIIEARKGKYGYAPGAFPDYTFTAAGLRDGSAVCRTAPDMPPMIRDRVASDLVNAVNAFVGEMLYIEGPESFKVRVSRRGRKRPKGAPKTQRQAHQRLFDSKPVHIIRSQDELAKMTEEARRTGTIKVTPHIRRGHWRYFWSDKFVNMQGKRTRIKEQYIGERQFSDDKREYKVIIRD